MRLLLSILFLFYYLGIFAQDTITVLQYNLLYYGVNTDFCTNSNNNINQKDGYLKTIINYTKPDIFTVNEISKSPAIHKHLLDQVLNTNGINYYRKSNFLSVAESNLANMLYYNSNKLRFHSHSIAQSYIRDIDVYKLYYNSNDLGQGDTAFIICVVAHLKSSDGTTNENKRKVMAQNTMNYLNDHDDDNNYLMMGDFNLYSNDESAYQEFLFYSNPSLRFHDPVDQYGPWHANFKYRHHHTQSTTSSSNGCKAGGGIDDRFDFILIANSIKDGSKNVQYIDGSYWAVGQDGAHFDKSITTQPENTSVPADVLAALYNNSDHLPIILKLSVDKSLGIYEWQHTQLHDVKIQNPFGQILRLNVEAKTQTSLVIDILNLNGTSVLQKRFKVERGNTQIEIPSGFLKSGFYLIRIIDEKGNFVVKKIIKN